MVFLALLRDPSLFHRGLHPAGEAVGRAGDVLLDPAAVLPAMARQVAGALGLLSPGVQALLLAAGRGCADPRLYWRSADQRLARGRRPGRRRLLLSSLPGDPAAGFFLRDAAAAADLDLGERAAWGSGGGCADGAEKSAPHHHADRRLRGQAATCVSFSDSSARS